MVDIIALTVSHALLLIAVWRLLWRDDIDLDAHSSSSPEHERAEDRDRHNASAPHYYTPVLLRQNGYRKMKLGRHAKQTDFPTTNATESNESAPDTTIATDRD